MRCHHTPGEPTPTHQRHKQLLHLFPLGACVCQAQAQDGPCPDAWVTVRHVVTDQRKGCTGRNRRGRQAPATKHNTRKSGMYAAGLLVLVLRQRNKAVFCSALPLRVCALISLLASAQNVAGSTHLGRSHSAHHS